MDLEHPAVTVTRHSGYPQPERTYFNEDQLGNSVFTGDEVLQIYDAYFLVRELEKTAIEALEELGAVYVYAK